MSCCVKCFHPDPTKGQKLTSLAGFETFWRISEGYQTNQPTEADKRVITKKILIIMVLE